MSNNNIDYPTSIPFGSKGEQWDEGTQAYKRMQMRLNKLYEQLEQLDKSIEHLHSARHHILSFKELLPAGTKPSQIADWQHMADKMTSEMVKLMDMRGGVGADIHRKEKWLRNNA